MNPGDTFLYGWAIGTFGTIAFYQWGGFVLALRKLAKDLNKSDKKE